MAASPAKIGHLAPLGALYAQLKRLAWFHVHGDRGFPPAATIPVSSNGKKILPRHSPRFNFAYQRIQALPTFPNTMERIGWRSGNPDKGTDLDCQH
jgi:hypothetical protein